MPHALPIRADVPLALGRGDELKDRSRRVYEENFGLYGSRTVWRQLLREGATIAECTVERLMTAVCPADARRGMFGVATVPYREAPCPLDKVNRGFELQRPNALRAEPAKKVSAMRSIVERQAQGVDFTYVHGWAVFVYVAFVIDASARRIVGWKISSSATAGFVLDAREQAVHALRPMEKDALVRHSDEGPHFLGMT